MNNINKDEYNSIKTQTEQLDQRHRLPFALWVFVATLG